jgi:HlyD family secretion protein
MSKQSQRYGWPAWTAAVLAAAALAGCGGSKSSGLITASGTIEAVEVNVASQTSGRLLRLVVDEGSLVKSGDVVAAVDSSLLEIQLQQAAAGVRLAEAQLALLLKGARIEDIRQADETVRQAEANLKLATDERDRIRNLYQKKSATLQQKDNAETRYTLASAQFEAAKEGLRKWQRLARPEEIEQGRARLDQAVAARDLLKKTIADSTILAPTAGVVTHKVVESGDYVGPGTTVVTVADLSRVYLEIFVTEPELGRVRLGSAADVTIDSYPEHAFKGTVIFVSPEAEFTPKNIQTKEERVKLVYRVKIEIPNPEGILKPGMPADASIAPAPSPASQAAS